MKARPRVRDGLRPRGPSSWSFRKSQKTNEGVMVQVKVLFLLQCGGSKGRRFLWSVDPDCQHFAPRNTFAVNPQMYMKFRELFGDSGDFINQGAAAEAAVRANNWETLSGVAVHYLFYPNMPVPVKVRPNKPSTTSPSVSVSAARIPRKQQQRTRHSHRPRIDVAVALESRT